MFVGTPDSQVIALDAATSQHLTVPVRLKGIRIERSRQFGDVYRRWRCGAGRAWRSCARSRCRRARSMSRGRR
jgi:hypothetical protein